MTESAENCGFGYNYWRNPSWKTSFFVQCPIYGSSWVCSQSQSFRRQFQRFKKISLFESLITKKKKKCKTNEQENSMLFMVSILLVVSLIDKLIKLQ